MGGVLTLSVIAALFEGIGLTFLLPIIRLAQADSSTPDDTSVRVFRQAYGLLNVPLTLETVVIGVVLVMFLRYASSFVVAWLKAKLRTGYVRNLQERTFENALSTDIDYFDDEGSDEIVNTVVTQTKYTGDLLDSVVRFVEQGSLSIIYLGVALYITPFLTVVSIVFLGSISYVLRNVIEPGYTVGDRVADANTSIQETAQAGAEGIRDVKLFGMKSTLLDRFTTATTRFENATITLDRNRAAIDNIYQFTIAFLLFSILYAALRFTPLSVAELSVFLFAMFRLAPRASTLNNIVYRIEGNLPHLVRTHRFIETLKTNEESNAAMKSLDKPIDGVSFEDVCFSYSDDNVLQNVSFTIQRGEFVAFVGQSGAGKSTIVSLLTQFYQPTDGQITADGTPIQQFELERWRSRFAVVRQHPYLFNKSLRYNLTLGEDDIDEQRFKRVCEVAQLTEFLDELPDGYETTIGNNGVRLSGGQRQRVAIARALLRDVDFLVLDEATSELDSTLEREVHTGIESMNRDHGIIAVAHRLSTTKDADIIYMMSDGEIAEQGTHSDLFANQRTYPNPYNAED
jgi:subfamily B ATP-binding cassette protein MsbA